MTGGWRGFEDMPADYARPRRRRQTAPLPEAEPGALFDAVLYPSRPLSSRGFVIIMGGFGAISAIAGAYFLAQGAWPVTGFFGLDWLALYIAFRMSYRSGRVRERIRIDREAIRIWRFLPSGFEKFWRVSPYWAQVEIDNPDAHESRLRVTSKGKSVILGSFLPPEERLQIGRAIRAALGKAKSPPSAQESAQE